MCINVFFVTHRASKTLDVGVDPLGPVSPLEAQQAYPAHGGTLPEGTPLGQTTNLDRAASSPHLGPTSLSLPPGMGSFLTAAEAEVDVDAATPQDFAPYNDVSTLPPPQLPKEQAPPTETTVTLPSPTTMEVGGTDNMSSFEDENGDPCSAV